MTPQHFAQIVAVETRKLFSRSSARFGLVFAVILGLGVPVLRGLVRLLEIQAADGQVDLLEPVDAAYVVYATLWLRNFFLMRIVLIMMGALSFAGEFQSRALREDVLRPVPRWALLAAKWLSLDVWIVATLLLTFAPAVLISLIAWGTQGDWGAVALGYLATAAADAGFAALVLMIAVILRSVAGTMVGMFLFYFFDVALGFGLYAIANMPDMFFEIPDALRKVAEQTGPWLPSSAFGVWQGASPSVPWAWQGFTSLGIITLLTLFVAERMFARMDVP